jgi:DNA polymerase-3 subunit beta
VADHYFRVHRSQFLSALTAALEAVEAKSTIPILTNVLIKPIADRLMLRGTTLDIEIEAWCDTLDVVATQGFTLAGKDLHGIIKNLPETAEITFAPGSSKDQVRISAGKSRFALLTLPEQDYPSMVQHVSGDSFTVDVPALAKAFGKVLHAVEPEKTHRVYLAGIHVHAANDGAEIRAVGCNGRNIAVMDVRTRSQASFPPAIIPVRTANAIRKLLGDVKAEAELTFSEVLMNIRCGDVSITSKLVDGKYPNYAALIPPPGDKEIVANIADFRASVTRVCLISEDMQREPIKVTLQKNMMRMQLSTQEGEAAGDDLAVEYGGADGFQIGFHGKLLAGLLDSVSGEDVSISIGANNVPVVFRPLGAEGELFALAPFILDGMSNAG